MCITVNKPTFEKAVEDVVTEMVSAKKTFSAHDVTKTLREKVNADQITVDTAETGVVHVAGKAVARIDHDTVKDVLSNLWDDKANKMVNYDRTFNGTYMEFAPGAPLTTGVVAPDPDPATTAAVSGSSYDGSSTI